MRPETTTAAFAAKSRLWSSRRFDPLAHEDRHAAWEQGASPIFLISAPRVERQVRGKRGVRVKPYFIESQGTGKSLGMIQKLAAEPLSLLVGSNGNVHDQ